MKPKQRFQKVVLIDLTMMIDVPPAIREKGRKGEKMKTRSLTLLIAIFAIMTMLFVSCNSDVTSSTAVGKPDEELVYASFTDNSKALSIGYDVPAYETLYWRYSAKKTDSYGTYGQTWEGETENFVPVKPAVDNVAQPGLDGKIGPFSQGQWTFGLEAYKTCTVSGTTYNYTDLVFKGSATGVILNKNQTNYIAVTVTPAGEYGKIKISDAYYEWAVAASAGTASTVKLEVSLVRTLPNSNDTQKYTYSEVLNKDGTNNRYPFVGANGYITITGAGTAIPAGVYTAIFRVVENTDAPTIDEFAIQTISFTVYGGFEVKVKGNLMEGLSYENYLSVPEQEIASTTSNNDGAASFVVDKTPSTATGESIKTTVVFPDNSLSTNTQHTLSVDVTTIETAETQFVIINGPQEKPEVAVAAIGLELTKTTVTKDEHDDVIDTTTEEVSDFDTYVTITTYIQDGLTGKVTVVYDDPNAGTQSAKSQPIAKEGATAETEGKSVATMYATDDDMGNKLGYSAESGKLRFKTDHFSDFYVKTDGLYVKNVSTGRYYPTLQSAVDAALVGQTLQLIQSISGISSVVVDSTKDITIDLNGKTITTGLKSEGRHYYAFDNYGSLTLKDSGTSGAIYARGAFENYGGNLTIESGSYHAVTDSADGGAVIWNENQYLIDSSATIYIHSSNFDTTDPIDAAGLAYLQSEGKVLINDSLSNYTNLGWVYFPDSIDTSGLGYGCNWYVNNSDVETVVAELTINGGSFIVEKVGSTSDSSGVACIINNGGNVEINDGSFISPNKRAYNVISNRGSMVINNATVEGAHGGIALDGGELILNSNISSTSTDYYGIWVTNNNEDVRIVVNGGSYSGKIGLNASVDDGNQDATDVEIIVYDGTFTGSDQSIKNNTKQTSHVWDMKLYGGYYSSDPSAYVAPGYYADEISEGTKWEVKPYTEDQSHVSVTKGSSTVYMPIDKFRDSVNNGTSYEGYTVKLLRNVDLEGVSWTPIGTATNPFRGTFDGDGKTIDNLSNHGFTSSTIDRTYNSGSSNAFALFGYLRGNVTIKDLTVYVYASDAKGKGYAGIVGLLKNDYETTTATADIICNLTLDNLKVYGEIIGEDKVAGVIAQVPNYGYTQPGYSSTTTINECENYATIKGERAGGILSVNSGAESGHTTITYCANHGTLTAPANGTYSVAAGIIAQTNTSNQNYYTVENCSNDGTISATIAYGLTANVFLHNPWTETYTPGTSIGGIDNVITDPAKFMELYYSFSGEAISPVRWKEVEYIAGNNETHSNVDHTGILAGIAYDVDETFVAQYDYTVGERVFTYRFKNMEEALSRFNKGANYSNLTLSADTEWKADYTQKGDGPGYYSINLNGNELTVKAPIHMMDSNNNGLQKPVEIKNGTIKYDGSFTGHLFEDVERHGSISFEKVVLDSSVPEEIISIFPSTGGNDTIGISFDNQSSGFFGKKIRCMSPGTGGGDLLVLNNESIPMNDSRWVPDGTSGQTVLTIESNEQVSIDGKPAITLKAFRDSVNDGNSYENSIVTLLCDVTTASDWTPIGNVDEKPFKGVFDGQNHTVTMTFNNDSSNEIALFGVVDGGTIKNLTVDGSINALEKAAGVMYKIQNGTVSNVTNNAKITVKKNKAGGIVCNSYYSNSFDNCKNTGTITISEAPNAQTNNVCGGIAAYIGNLNDSKVQTFTGCVNNGDIVIANNNGYGAGIVGYASGGNQTGTIVFENCINCGQAAYGLLAYVHASGSTQTVSMGTCYDLTGKSLCYCHEPTKGTFSITGPLYVKTGTANVIVCGHDHAPSLVNTETGSTFEYGGQSYYVDKYVLGN